MSEGMRYLTEKWHGFVLKHGVLAEFITFFMVSNGVTLLQLVLMPIFKEMFGKTDLVNISFQIGKMGKNFDGSDYYIFNYAGGAIALGGGGGLAYFLAVQVTMAIAQVFNFFIQRKVTFKSTGKIWKAAFWYLVAYIVITVSAAAALGFYKAPVYHLLIDTWNLGRWGETVADVVTMIINCIISFWVFFPILKMIFRGKES